MLHTPRAGSLHDSTALPVQARRSLELVRGTADVDKEFNDMVQAGELARAIKHPWKVCSYISLHRKL